MVDNLYGFFSVAYLLIYVGDIVAGNDEALGDVAVRKLDLHDEVGDVLEKLPGF